MAFSTVAEAFAELLTRIELNPARVTLASQRYNAIKTTIEGALPGTRAIRSRRFRPDPVHRSQFGGTFLDDDENFGSEPPISFP